MSTTTPPFVVSSAFNPNPNPNQQQLSPQITNSSPSSSSSSLSLSSSLAKLSPSIIITLLIVSVTIILTTSLCLLFRHFHRLPNFLSRHRHVSPTPPAPTTAANTNTNGNNNNYALINSLPLFTFSSVTRRSSSATAAVDGDCAVCLSKFSPHDKLRLLPLCCHAFHVQCIDTWLSSNHDTCPLCRSNVYDLINSSVLSGSLLQPSNAASSTDGSFRLEIGSVSRRRDASSDGRRSYSIGSFDYIVEADSEVSVGDRHRRSISFKEDDVINLYGTNNVDDVAADVAEGGRSWLGEYMDRLSATMSSRTASFSSSRRFFTGSSRRSEVAGVGEWDIEASRVGEEISELFRWASGV